MGKLLYGGRDRSFDIDDRLLAHLRLVIMNKLRRAEPFMYHHVDAHLTTSLWIHPSVPLVLHFYGSRAPMLNPAWVDELMRGANSAQGLYLTPEPARAVTGTPAPLPL